MFTRITTALLLTTSLACAGSDDHDHDHVHDTEAKESAHKVELDGITLLHAWTAASDADKTLVFVEIENASDTKAILKGAETDKADSVALVGFQMKDGEGVYAPLGELPIAAGTDLNLVPNGVAFELSGVKEHFHEGDEFEMHIEFARGEVHMMVQVEPEGAKQHSHAGHNH